MSKTPRFHLVHVAPDYLLSRPGAECTAEFEAHGDTLTVRSIPTGAVPHVPISALSRAPHRDTVDREAISSLLGWHHRDISARDLELFRAGRKDGRESALADY